jgi:TonB family protein
MARPTELHLVTLLEKERDSARRRESVFFSVILHLVFIIIVIINPKFLSTLFKSDAVIPPPQKEVTELIAPALMERAQPKAPPPVRGHIQPPPPTTPKPGGTEAPSVKKIEPPPAEVAQQPKTAEPPAAGQQQAQLNTPKGPVLEDLNSGDRQGRSDSKLNLGDFSGKSLEDTMREAGRNRGSGGVGSGDGLKGPGGGQRSNLSIDEPIILSDTYGVDLDPYLRRIYFIVRANWYSLIPELIYTGRKGRVTIVFDIKKNGALYNMNVVARSGTTPYDNAAVGSLNMSSPLPALPNYFPGDHITMQYTYLYNLAPRN